MPKHKAHVRYDGPADVYVLDRKRKFEPGDVHPVSEEELETLLGLHADQFTAVDEDGESLPEPEPEPEIVPAEGPPIGELEPGSPAEPVEVVLKNE